MKTADSRQRKKISHLTSDREKVSSQPSVGEILYQYKSKYINNQETVQQESLPEEDELLQVKFGIIQSEESDDEILQGEFESAELPNYTGLPDHLKAGIENLSGYSMDDVRVHYDSPKPAQLQALAYAQGTNIHVAPGQERHVPHEAWHIVQQKQGRVQPTMQMQGVNVNDDEALEHEADMMGEKAQRKQESILFKRNASINNAIAQRVIVRVGYDKTKADSPNKFISTSHKVLESETEKLGYSAMPLFDYINQNTLHKKEKGKNRTDLYILGHGKPGSIAGIPVNTLAQNTRSILKRYGYKAIANIHLHSCFSNVQEGGGDGAGESARDAFSGEFNIDYILAAAGLLYSTDHTVLPPKYMGCKLGASFAKKAISENLETVMQTITEKGKTIDDLYLSFSKCTLPFEVLLKKTFASEDGFQYVDKSESNTLPTIEDNGIDSIRNGLDNTLGVINRDLHLSQKQKEEFKTKYDQCIANFNIFRGIIPANVIA